MTVAYDNDAVIVTTGDITPVSSTPKGVLVLYAAPGTTPITGITCEGTAMEELTSYGSPAILSSVEPGLAQAFFLGSGIPASTPLTITSDVAATFVVYTLTNDQDCAVIDAALSVSDGGSPGPTTVTIGEDCFVAGGMHSSTNSLIGISNPPAGTVSDRSADLGNSCVVICHRTSLGTPPDDTIDWTGSFPSEHENVIVAIGDAPPPPPPVTLSVPQAVELQGLILPIRGTPRRYGDRGYRHR